MLIFNYSPLDGTISRQVLKPGALKFFLALPDLSYDLQLGPVPTPVSKNGSFDAHVLENTRALELVSHRHLRWDNNVHSPQSWCYQILFSSYVVWTTWSTYKLKSVFSQWIRTPDSGTCFQQMANIIIFDYAMSPSKVIHL